MDAWTSALNWPVAAIVIAIVAMVLFRSQLGALISRTKSVGKGGIETFDQRAPQLTNERKGLEEFMRSFDNPLLVEGEQRIVADLQARGIQGPEDREKALVRALAAANATLHFERAHAAIWASQLTLLKALNAGPGLSHAEVRPIYEAAKAAYPQLYQNYTFENWLGFLERFELAQIQNNRIVVTMVGREFLKFLIATARYEPTHG